MTRKVTVKVFRIVLHWNEQLSSGLCRESDENGRVASATNCALNVAIRVFPKSFS